MEYAVPLQPFIDRDAEDPLLAWSDIPDGIKRKDSWSGQTYTFIVDNDNQTMFYRKDILGDPKYQDAYRTATGKDLPNPPQTLPEFIEVAKFFSPSGGGAGWSDQGEAYGFITCVLRGQQSYWYSYPWTAPYSVVPSDKAPVPGIYIFDPDMNPLINTEGYVRGLHRVRGGDQLSDAAGARRRPQRGHVRHRRRLSVDVARLGRYGPVVCQRGLRRQRQARFRPDARRD